MKYYSDGGEAILSAFRTLNVEYIISSPGSEWAPIWEALARQKTKQQLGPKYIEVWHETLAVDIALGYTHVTGRPQVVLLHAGSGLLQGSMGIYAATMFEIPMLILSGGSLTYGENVKRPIEAQWYRTLNTPGGLQRLVEPITKWSTQISSVHIAYETVLRGYEISTRVPLGPVYLNTPIDVLLDDWEPGKNVRSSVPAAPKLRAHENEISAALKLLLEAKNPVILSDAAGRDSDGFDALVEFAEFFGVPVGSGHNISHGNFPKSHSLFMGSELDKYMSDVDLALLVSCKTPWNPPSSKPFHGPTIAIDQNPIKPSMDYQSLLADFYVEGDLGISLRLLVSEAKKSIRVDAYSERRERWSGLHAKMVAAQGASAKDSAKGGAPISTVSVVEALKKALPMDAVFVDETLSHSPQLQQLLPWSCAQSYFRSGHGLGQGIGIALGVKLASSDRFVVLIVGDGSFLYNPIVQALAASKNYDLPVLIVVMNNQKYKVMELGHKFHYPDGVAFEAGLQYGVELSSAPAFETLGEPFSIGGRRVSDAASLYAAFEEAVRSVRSGRTFIVNVLIP